MPMEETLRNLDVIAHLNLHTFTHGKSVQSTTEPGLGLNVHAGIKSIFTHLAADVDMVQQRDDERYRIAIKWLPPTSN